MSVNLRHNFKFGIWHAASLTLAQQDSQSNGYRRRHLDSDDVEESNNLPVDQRSAARSAKVIRRYVPLVASERKAPPTEDLTRMQAWLGRFDLVLTQPPPRTTSKTAHRRKNKVAHVKAVKTRRTLDLCLIGTYSLETGAAEEDPGTHPAPPAAQHEGRRKRPRPLAPSTSTTAPPGEARLKSGNTRVLDPAAPTPTPFLDYKS